MFTRMLTCTIKMGKKEEFLEAARQLRKAYADQPGFVDLLAFLGDEQPQRALVAAVWKSKSASDEFYLKRAPLLELKPFLEEQQIEHYHLEVSNLFGIAAGKAA